MDIEEMEKVARQEVEDESRAVKKWLKVFAVILLAVGAGWFFST